MKRNKPKGKMTLIFAAFLLCAAILGIFMLLRYQGRDVSVPQQPVPQQTGQISLTLFFGAPGGDGLVREGRNVDACADAAACIATIVQELAGGPLGDLEPTIPVQTVVRSVQPGNDSVTIDLESGFVQGVPPGSAGEVTAVYSLVNSIVINFPAFRTVTILVDGKPIESLHGHLDLRQPLTPDFSLEKTPETQNNRP